MSAQPLDQRREALEHSHRVRAWRVRLKHDVKTDPSLAIFQIKSPTPWAEAMRASDLVGALPYYGPVKTNKVLKRCGIPWTKSIGALTQRQRDELVKALA
jgi:hypothetical protein